MKLTFLIVVIALLCGSCSVSPEQWDGCVKACTPFGGVERFGADDRSCHCKNGLRIYRTHLIGKEKDK